MYNPSLPGALMMTGAAALAASSCTSEHSAKNSLPNVVFILADDLGWGDLSCYGQERFTTPNIDRLAAEGMLFTQCYSGTTVSAPSRSCLITGTHSGHTPIRGNREMVPEGQFPLPEGVQTIFHDFREAGYTTGAFGKWGLGFIGTSGDPRTQGVDRFYGYNCQLLAHSYYPNRTAHTFQLEGEALSVSGKDPHGRGHIIDPATGNTLEKGGLVAVTGPSAMVTEVLSTALWVAPAERRGDILAAFDGYRASEVRCLTDGQALTLTL